MHKYNFYGEVRTYKNKLTLIDESVIYIGITDEVINHWDKAKNFYPHTNVLPTNYTVEQFLDDTKQYASAKFHESALLKHKDSPVPKLAKEPKPLYYVYKVDGEMRYYQVEQSIFNLRENHAEVEYMGIKFGIVPTKKSKSVFHRTSNKDRYCCYCDVRLTIETFTREHVIPKSRGGKIIKPCCKECNYEKGALMLHSYIQMLNLRLCDVSGEGLTKLQTKIINANKIAQEISRC